MIEAFLDVAGAWAEPLNLMQSLKPAGYCLAAAPLFYLGISSSAVRRSDIRVQRVWMLLSGLYLLLAANALVSGDALFIQWLRPIFKAQHWYESRRLFQIAFLVTAGLGLAFWLLSRPWQELQASREHCARALLWSAVLGTSGVYFLRFVSFHYTDLVLNARWLNQSTATWAEIGFVGLAGLGTVIAMPGRSDDVQ